MFGTYLNKMNVIIMTRTKHYLYNISIYNELITSQMVIGEHWPIDWNVKTPGIIV